MLLVGGYVVNALVTSYANLDICSSACPPARRANFQWGFLPVVGPLGQLYVLQNPRPARQRSAVGHFLGGPTGATLLFSLFVMQAAGAGLLVYSGKPAQSRWLKRWLPAPSLLYGGLGVNVAAEL